MSNTGAFGAGKKYHNEWLKREKKVTPNVKLRVVTVVPLDKMPPRVLELQNPAHKHTVTH